MWEATGGGLSVTLSKKLAAFVLILGPVNNPPLLPEWKEADDTKDTGKKIPTLLIGLYQVYIENRYKGIIFSSNLRGSKVVRPWDPPL